MISDSQKLELDSLRKRIDAIDDQFLSLINDRADLAAEVARCKSNQGDAPYYVPSREAEIIRRLLANNKGVVPDVAVHGIFREVIGACLALESPMTIAYLGPQGTFTHLAACRQFGSSATFMACKGLDEVFDEVEGDRATYGVVPVENAFEGAVTHTLDLFVDGRVSICAEVVLQIHHHLISTAGSLKEIRKLVSHPQALAQCRQWLHANLPLVETLETSSTAEAVERIVDDRSIAAVGSLSVAERLGLPILRRNIEDHHENTTRFLVIGRHDSPPSGDDKTAVILSASNQPGALHALLTPFASRHISLSQIESRPSKRELWQYFFFVDIIGHQTDEGIAEALAEIRAMPGAYIKMLGSYPTSKQL